MLVKNRMTRNVVTVSPSDTLYHVLTTLEDNKFDGIPIVDNGKVVGVVDEKIIMREFCSCCAQQNNEAGIDTDMPIPFSSTKVKIEPDKRRIAHFLHRRTVSELILAEQKVVTIHADEPIEEASYVMFINEVDLLPVVDDAGHLIGVLSKGDILRVFDEVFGHGPEGGDRIIIAVPDVVGMLADITSHMKRNGINIESILAYHSRFYATTMVVMKVERGKGQKAKAILERNGCKLIGH